MRLVRSLFVALALAALPLAGAAVAQESSAPRAAAAPAGQAADPTDPAQATRIRAVQAEAGGLPVRAAPPRTLRDYWHVFVAFALAWVLLFGYTVSLARRFARVERELAARS